jgi:hypothetical protein
MLENKIISSKHEPRQKPELFRLSTKIIMEFRHPTGIIPVNHLFTNKKIKNEKKKLPERYKSKIY